MKKVSWFKYTASDPEDVLVLESTSKIIKSKKESKYPSMEEFEATKNMILEKCDDILKELAK